VALLTAGRESEGGYRFDRPNPDASASFLSDFGMVLCLDRPGGVVGFATPSDDPPPPEAPTIKAAGAAAPVGAGLATSNAPDTDGTGLILLAFVAGYQAGGGPPELLDHFLYVVIPCESGWRLDPPGYHRGLAQFAPDSWERAAALTGCWAYADAYCQGLNVGVWSQITTPSEQWGCW
jgi:hypothetical protein